jgi:hypothetical protein
MIGIACHRKLSLRREPLTGSLCSKPNGHCFYSSRIGTYDVWHRHVVYNVHNCPPLTTVMNTMERQGAGSKRRAQQVFISNGPQEEAGSWVQGQAEGHTQGRQKGNSTGREKANNVVREIRQGADDRKSDRQKYRQGIGKVLLLRMAKNYDTQEG